MLISVSVQSLYGVRVARTVSRKLFTPQPNVDSAVVVMQKKEGDLKASAVLRKLIRAAFAMRRKTLVNNLTTAFPLSRAEAEQALARLSLPADIRGEALTVEQFGGLAVVLASCDGE